MSSRRRRSSRWLLGVGSAMAIAGALGTSPTAGAALAPGVGNSFAQSFQATPHEGSLAVGIVLGEALAGHTNYVARAQSQGVDLGSVGLALQGYNCGTAPSPTQVALVPQPLQTETGETGADKGVTLTPSDGVATISSTSFPPSSGSTEHVVANKTPYGEADTSYGLIQGGVVVVSGMRSRAWSGVVNGRRVAGATSDIGAIDLVASAVVLKNLHWEVEYPSGGSGPPTGSFSIGQLLVSGKPVPGNDASALIAAANKVLGTFGMALEQPATNLVQGVQFVTPLQLLVVPNKTRDAITTSVIAPAQKALFPVLNGLENGFSPAEPAQLAKLVCQTDTPITVADITIASIDGGGYFSTAFGGVNATSGDAPANAFDLSRFQPALGLGTSQTVGATPAISATPPVPAVPANPAPAVAGTTLNETGAATRSPRVVAATGHRLKGPLLAIGLGGLGLLVLLAEGDRRVMRRASHSAT